MNVSLRLTAALPAFAALLLLGSHTPLRAADDDAAARRAAADELMTSLHMQGFIESTTKRIVQSLDVTVDKLEKQPSAKPEQVADADKMREELHTMVTQQVNWDAMKGDLAQTYADDFTVAELKDISTFYRTPAGAKLADKQPELTEKVNKAIQQRAGAIAPAVNQKLRALAMKMRPVTPPTPVSPATGPVGPAVPPTTPALAPLSPPTLTPPPAPVAPPPAAPKPVASPTP